MPIYFFRPRNKRKKKHTIHEQSYNHESFAEELLKSVTEEYKYDPNEDGAVLKMRKLRDQIKRRFW